MVVYGLPLLYALMHWIAIKKWGLNLYKWKGKPDFLRICSRMTRPCLDFNYFTWAGFIYFVTTHFFQNMHSNHDFAEDEMTFTFC